MPHSLTAAKLHCRTVAGASAPSRWASAHRLTSVRLHRRTAFSRDQREDLVDLVTPMELVERLNLVTPMELLERVNLKAPMELLERLNL
jgi:hypothetical protein